MINREMLLGDDSGRMCREYLCQWAPLERLSVIVFPGPTFAFIFPASALFLASPGSRTQKVTSCPAPAHRLPRALPTFPIPMTAMRI